ncbi:5-(carboxyamino)imidazole ribonucleotide synthase [Falsibacillus albus]|uniref:N5-carboxyaminoimidazole ribonucleotide synthase n=1 Tax=Falsibacillus albus TaxID=2478915 RepID=A0A3L7JIR4_9BACI|nr:5-(carboxyamino)imidazole ribonucleotide synthase [Falsibacillus albus]RLQ90677.1 5-(carboxyamino)imidazole ribonucleotide synthase [Falsibacillus albus]
MANHFIQPGSTIGIIGGGQLGRMMALAAKEAGYRIIVLDPTEDCPAGQAADQQIVATYDDLDALKKLGQLSDVVTFEFENIDYGTLKELTETAYVPQGADIIRITQDRILEKAALVEAGVEVAPYAVIHEKQEIYDNIDRLGFPAVLKTSRGGYDGKGQHVIKSTEDIAEAADLLGKGPCVLEAWIPFEKEVSVIVARNPDGNVAYFPVGENIHVQNILHETIVPARVNTSTADEAYQVAEKVAEHFALVGTLAIEMFVAKDGGILVNELAPRPHNSGHYSIEACSVSQFGQHIRAVCNWPLTTPKLLKPAVMVNLLGKHLDVLNEEIVKNPHWSVHLYGKDVPKPLRKMGHVTVLADQLEDTLDELEKNPVWNEKV